MVENAIAPDEKHGLMMDEKFDDVVRHSVR